MRKIKVKQLTVDSFNDLTDSNIKVAFAHTTHKKKKAYIKYSYQRPVSFTRNAPTIKQTPDIAVCNVPHVVGHPKE